MRYGWNKEYVGNFLTLEQISFFYQEAKKQESQILKLQTICVSMAVNAAICGDKDGKFKEFLNMLYPEKVDLNIQLENAKKSGLPIEEN